MKVSALPKRLTTFSQSELALDGCLSLAQRDIDMAYPPYANGCHPNGWTVQIRALGRIPMVADQAKDLDSWVGDVSRWFEAADGGTLASLPPALVARVMASVTVSRPNWPAGVVLGYNALDAPRAGTFDLAGYGRGCSDGHTAGRSILGPDGRTYPVIVPGGAGSASESTRWMPSEGGDIAMGAINDTRRTWHTVMYSEALVTPKNSAVYRSAGAIAATAGWAPVNGASVSPAEIGRALRVAPNGQPYVVPKTVRRTALSGASLAENPSASPLPKVEGSGGVTDEAFTRAGQVSAVAGMADLAVSAHSGWKAASNEGTGFVQAQYQEDDKGHRRVLVRGYEVRVSDGTPVVSGAYWNGEGWTPLGTPTLRTPPIMTKG